MHTDELKKEMINRKYRLIVDQDFIDIYYIVFDIYKDCNDTVMGMYNMLKKYVSYYVKEYPLKDLKNVCYHIIRETTNGVYINNCTYEEFVDRLLPYYKTKYIIYKNIDKQQQQIDIDNDKKYYGIELSFDEIITINTISGAIGGFLRTSRRHFSKDGCVVVMELFNVPRFIGSGACSGIHFDRDVLRYIKK